jgi:hypothetical protein
MQTSTQSNEAAPPVQRRAHVTGAVHLDGIDRARADRSAQLLRDLAAASAQGALEIVEAYDEARSRLVLTVTGSLPGVLRLLNGKTQAGERLIEERVGTSLVADVDSVGSEKAVAINDHLLNAAKNHPPGDPPLDVRTEHDAPHARLRVRVDGSLFATSYLLFLVNLHLTQSRT